MIYMHCKLPRLLLGISPLEYLNIQKYKHILEKCSNHEYFAI